MSKSKMPAFLVDLLEPLDVASELEIQLVTKRGETVVGRGISIAFSDDHVPVANAFELTKAQFETIKEFVSDTLLFHPGLEIRVELRPGIAFEISPTADFPYFLRWELPMNALSICNAIDSLKQLFYSGDFCAHFFERSGTKSVFKIRAANMDPGTNSIPVTDTVNVPTDAPAPTIDNLVVHEVAAETEVSSDPTTEVSVIEKKAIDKTAGNKDFFSSIMQQTAARTSEITKMTPEERREASKNDPIENMKKIVADRKSDEGAEPSEIEKLFQGDMSQESIKARLEKMKDMFENMPSDIPAEMFPDEPQPSSNKKLSDEEVHNLLNSLSDRSPHPKQAEVDDLVEHPDEVCPPPDGSVFDK